MAEENDQNAVQPQNDEQQTVPMPSVDAEQTQTYAGEPYAAESATEPIDVQGGIEDQPTAAMPVANDGASAESAAAAGDTPDYASAAGERTVVGGSTQDAPAQQYRPAPEYGAYGPVPTQPADGTAAANDTANGAPNMPPQPQYGAYGQASGQQPQQHLSVLGLHYRLQGRRVPLQSLHHFLLVHQNASIRCCIGQYMCPAPQTCLSA